MPAAPDIINENAFLPTLLHTKTNDAPNAVSAQVNVVAMSACCQPLSDKNQVNRVSPVKTVLRTFYAFRLRFVKRFCSKTKSGNQSYRS